MSDVVSRISSPSSEVGEEIPPSLNFFFFRLYLSSSIHFLPACRSSPGTGRSGHRGGHQVRRQHPQRLRHVTLHHPLHSHLLLLAAGLRPHEVKQTDAPPVLRQLLLSSSLIVIIDDTDLREDNNPKNEFSIFINNDLTRLDKVEFWTQLNKLCYF